MPDDIIIRALKQRWFSLAPQEDYPRTPKITAEMDQLEEAIRAQKTGRAEKGINPS